MVLTKLRIVVKSLDNVCFIERSMLLKAVSNAEMSEAEKNFARSEAASCCMGRGVCCSALHEALLVFLCKKALAGLRVLQGYLGEV